MCSEPKDDDQSPGIEDEESEAGSSARQVAEQQELASPRGATGEVFVLVLAFEKSRVSISLVEMRAGLR